MRNPYEVLEISPGASDADIKAAYREMVKKYHPDKYQNNPLSDLAEEKLQEINEAYDALMKGTGGGNSGGYSNSGGNANSQSSVSYNDIRGIIDSGNLDFADRKLKQMSGRDAEWYFLSGIISQRKGWYDDALNKFQTAVSMNPNNFEYNQALNSMRGGGRVYQNQAYGRGYGSQDDMFCKMCQAYICLDCLCDCI